MSVNLLCSNNLTNSENFTKDLGAVFGGSLHSSKSLNEATHYVLRSKTCQPVAFEERKCTGSLVQPPAISQSRDLSQFQLSIRAAPRWSPAPSARSPMAGRGGQGQVATFIVFPSLGTVSVVGTALVEGTDRRVHAVSISCGDDRPQAGRSARLVLKSHGAPRSRPSIVRQDLSGWRRSSSLDQAAGSRAIIS